MCVCQIVLDCQASSVRNRIFKCNSCRKLRLDYNIFYHAIISEIPFQFMWKKVERNDESYGKLNEKGVTTAAATVLKEKIT